MSQRISSERVLMPTAEACKVAGFSRQHIHRLLRGGLIEGIKLGHDWLVYEDSLTAYLAQPRKRGPKGPHTPSPQGHTKGLSAGMQQKDESSTS